MRDHRVRSTAGNSSESVGSADTHRDLPLNVPRMVGELGGISTDLLHVRSGRAHHRRNAKRCSKGLFIVDEPACSRPHRRRTAARNVQLKSRRCIRSKHQSSIRANNTRILLLVVSSFACGRSRSGARARGRDATTCRLEPPTGRGWDGLQREVVYVHVEILCELLLHLIDSLATSVNVDIEGHAARRSGGRDNVSN